MLYMMKMKRGLSSVYLRCNEYIPRLDFEIEVGLSLNLLLSCPVECKNFDGRISYAITLLHFLLL